MATYPLATLAAEITSAGAAYPSYADTLASLKASFKLIYGSDAYLEPDSQDGQFVAFLAQLVYDQNQAIEAAYLSMSPDFAQGAGLSALVKLNGLSRLVATKSTATLLLGGAIGTVINSGQVVDVNGVVWALPSVVTIDSSGTAVVTATATQDGAVAAAVGAINSIRTPVLGWASVTNTTAATLGAPVESDAALKARQTASTSLPAQTVLEGVVSSVLALAGVSEVVGYENDTDLTDANGLPPHSISLVVAGGDAVLVAEAINKKKTPGTATYGSTSTSILDLNGAPKTIKFYRPVPNELKLAITIKALPGYASTTGDALKAALSSFVKGLKTGSTVFYSRLYLPAQLNGQGAWQTYEITSLQVAKLSASFGTSDIAQAIFEDASLLESNITLTVT